MKAMTCALAAISLATAASAQPITPKLAEKIVGDFGANILETRAGSDSAHVIDAESDGTNISVRLGDCDAETYCSYVMMFATFDLGGPVDEAALQKTNGYNDSHSYGRAFAIPGLDSNGVVGIDYVIDISGDANFDTADLERFKSVLAAYITYWTTSQ